MLVAAALLKTTGINKKGWAMKKKTKHLEDKAMF